MWSACKNCQYSPHASRVRARIKSIFTPTYHNIHLRQGSIRFQAGPTPFFSHSHWGLPDKEMGEERIVVDRQILNSLHDAITAWIPKRRETVAAMEELADHFRQEGRVVLAVRAGAGAGAGAIGLAAVLGTGGLVIPLLAAAGGLGAIAGAEVFKKHRLTTLQEKIQAKFEEEVESYITVIDQYDRLNKAIEKSNQKSALSDEHCKLLDRYSTINQQIAKVKEIVSESITDSLQGLATTAMVLTMKEICDIAKKPVLTTAVAAIMQGLPGKTSVDIAKEAGTAVGIAVLEIAKKLAGLRTDLAAFKREVLKRAKQASIAFFKRVLEFLPFKFVLKSVKVGIQEYQEIADVEKELRERIVQSKKEANKCVREIYFFLMMTAIPFPQNKL